MAVKFKPLQVDSDPEAVLAKTQEEALKEKGQAGSTSDAADPAASPAEAGKVVVESAPAPTPDPADIGPGGIDLSGIPRHIDGRPLNMRTRMDLYGQKIAEQKFKEQIGAVRINKPEPPKPVYKPDIPEHTRKQTEAEMAAGRAASERARAQQAKRTIPQKREPWEGTNTQIIRPEDFQRSPGQLRGKGETAKVSSTVV